MEPPAAHNMATGSVRHGAISMLFVLLVMVMVNIAYYYRVSSASSALLTTNRSAPAGIFAPVRPPCRCDNVLWSVRRVGLILISFAGGYPLRGEETMYRGANRCYVKEEQADSQGVTGRQDI